MGGARMGARLVAALRGAYSRRLRRLSLAHERAARRPGSGAKRAPKTGRGRRGRAAVTGADETVVRVNGEKAIIGVATDAETGQVLGLEALVKRDSDGFMEWLGDFVSDYGVEAMVADDLSAYNPTVERHGIEQ